MKKQILDMYAKTMLSKQEIAEILGITFSVVEHTIMRYMSKEDRNQYKRARYSQSKLGAKNPMKGKIGEGHHNYKGDCLDGKGYVMTLKPTWYTGRVGSKHVFKHSVVMCESIGLTQIPEGFVVHHIDKDPLNNEPHNLALMTVEAHSRLHQLERATTRVIRRLQEESKRVAIPESDMEPLHSFFRD